MSYVALYRKFRPATFESVKGQDHIVTTLKNQINANRIGHAYLFCGTRGTGKTSVAKIFARAVNCEHPVDGSPCGECASCRSILEGKSMNVVEIDAASNNGVDNIRQIREEIQYSPTDAKYKIYIIDEVHMLSIGAFNALLKTLEEPPAYVIFILATTEAHKIPITILSRCQRYDFKRISIETITERMAELMKAENIEVEDKALRYVAKAADGSMRDALSLLDQCIAFYLGKKLTYDNVLEVLGAVDTEVFSALLKAIVDEDVTTCLHIVEDMIIKGRELGQFVTDFIWYLRNLLLVKTSENADEIIDASSEKLDVLKAEAQMFETPVIMRYIRIFSELSNQMRYATGKRVLLETALIKLMKPSMENNTEALINRISNLERKIENGVVAVNVNNATVSTENPTTTHEQPKKVLEQPIPEDVQYVVDNWGKVIKNLDTMYRTYLKKARFSVKGNDTLLVVFEEDSTGYDAFNSPEKKKMLEDEIQNNTGKQIRVEVEVVSIGHNFSDEFQEVINKKIKMDIIEEDF
jgi:DNA polymerase-3 subunit gamma/tau